MNLFEMLFGLIVLIHVVEFIFNIPPSTSRNDCPLRVFEDDMDDSPTYLNDPLHGGPRPQGGPLYH